MNPSSRALYWYLHCCCRAEQLHIIHVKTASLDSGIPVSTIYESIKRFPGTFVLIGSSIALNGGALNARQKHDPVPAPEALAPTNR